MLQQQGLICTCGNNTESEFAIYTGERDRFLGYRCKRNYCGREWLTSMTEREMTINIGNDLTVSLHRKGSSKPSGRTRFKNLKEARKNLRKGDHICWRRRFGNFHHAVVTGIMDKIVEVVQVSKNWCAINVTEYLVRPSPAEESNGEGVLMRFIRDCSCCRGGGQVTIERGPVFRMDYQDDHSDIPELVLARALSLVEENKPYYLFGSNCEHIATFCKTGSPKWRQKVRLRDKFKEIFAFLAFRMIVINIVFIFLAEVLEDLYRCEKPSPIATTTQIPRPSVDILITCDHCAKSKDMLGAFLILCCEVFKTIFVLRRLRGMFRNGRRSRLDYRSLVCEEIMESLSVSLLVITLSIDCLLGFLEPRLWVFFRLFSLLLGIPVFKYFGMQIGRIIGAYIVSFTKYDDIRVLSPISELAPGDVIFTRTSSLCPFMGSVVYGFVYSFGEELHDRDTQVAFDQSQVSSLRSDPHLSYGYKTSAGTFICRSLLNVEPEFHIHRVLLPRLPMNTFTFQDFMTAERTFQGSGRFANQSKQFSFYVREILERRYITNGNAKVGVQEEHNPLMLNGWTRNEMRVDNLNNGAAASTERIVLKDVKETEESKSYISSFLPSWLATM